MLGRGSRTITFVFLEGRERMSVLCTNESAYVDREGPKEGAPEGFQYRKSTHMWTERSLGDDDGCSKIDFMISTLEKTGDMWKSDREGEMGERKRSR